MRGKESVKCANNHALIYNQEKDEIKIVAEDPIEDFCVPDCINIDMCPLKLLQEKKIVKL